MAASACYGYEELPGVLVAAASNAMWNKSEVCGKKFSVICIGATNLAPNPCTSSVVDVIIVDYCPRCRSTINLSRDAFNSIADPKAGRIKIEYDEYVS